MGKIRFKKRPGQTKAPQEQRASEFDPELTTYEEAACARTWSEAFSHACPGSEEDGEEKRGPPASRGQQPGSTSNERLLSVLSVVLNHMRPPMRERDLIELEDPFDTHPEEPLTLTERWSPFGEMVKMAGGKSSLDESEDGIEDESEDEDEEAEKPDLEALCLSVGEAMGPGLGAVVLGLCSTCRGAWVMRKADRLLAAVARLAALYRNMAKVGKMCGPEWDWPRLRRLFDPEAFHMVVRRRCPALPATTRRASYLLQGVFEHHIYRLCRLALHLSVHRGRPAEEVALAEFDQGEDIERYGPSYSLRVLRRCPQWAKRGCVLTVADLQAAVFLLRTLRPGSDPQNGADCSMGGGQGGGGGGGGAGSDLAEEEDGRWVLEDEGMMRVLVRMLRFAGVVEVQGLQVLPRLAAELGHMARAVARVLQNKEEAEQLDKQQVEGDDVALRAFVGGSDPEDTLARVLAREEEEEATAAAAEEDNEEEGAEGDEGEEEEEEEGNEKDNEEGDKEEEEGEEENEEEGTEGDEEEEQEQEEDGGRVIDVHMVAAVLHDPPVGSVLHATGMMQGKLGEDWQPAFRDDENILHGLWLTALKEEEEKRGMQLRDKHYRRFDRKARLLMRSLVQQDLEAVLGAAVGVVAKVRTSGYPDGGEEHERQLCFMDLCIAESVVLDGDVEWSWKWEYDTLTTGQIMPKDLAGNFAYPKRSEEQKRELKRLLDYLMEGITGLVGGEKEWEWPAPEDDDFDVFEEELMARWLCLRARAVLQAMMAQMATTHEAWAAQAEGTQGDEEEDEEDGDSDEEEDDGDKEEEEEVDVAGKEDVEQGAAQGPVPQGQQQQEAMEVGAIQPQDKEQEAAVAEDDDDDDDDEEEEEEGDDDYGEEGDADDDEQAEMENGEGGGVVAVLTAEAVCRALRQLDRATRAGESGSQDWVLFARCRAIYY